MRITVAAAVVVFLLSGSPPLEASVRRSAADVAWAIGLSAPAVAESARQRYAEAIVAMARQHDIDPFTAVALFSKESGFRAASVSPDGEDIGLGQIRARFVGACKNDPHPVPIALRNADGSIARDASGTVVWAHRPSAACRAVRESLKHAPTNIALVGNLITTWRRQCRKATGRKALLHRMLAGYGGLSRPSRGIWCGMKRERGRFRDLPVHPHVARIISHRKMLIAKLSKRPRRGSRSR